MKLLSMQTIGAAAPLIFSGAAHGGFVGLTVEQRPMDDHPGLLTFRIYAQFDGTQGQSGNDFMLGVADDPLQPLNLQVRKGMFFQHASNTHGRGDLSPDPVLCDSDPSVCLDTFVTIGKDTSIGDATQLSPGWCGFAPDCLACPGGGGWFITPDGQQGLPDQNDRVLLAQLSTEDGVGFFGKGLVLAFSNGDEFLFVESFAFDTGCSVDIDGDDLVDIGDLLIVIAQWGACPPTCLGDVTANGEVGIYDLLEVLAEWGPCG